MNTQPASPQPNTPEASNPNEGMLVTDNGDIIRIHVHGSTYLLRDEVASVVRKHRALYADNSTEASAFLHGIILALGIFCPPKGKQNGKAAQN